MDKFTVRAQEAIESAVGLAESHSQQSVETEHLLAALIGQAEGVARPMLGKIGAKADQVLAEVQEVIARLPQVSGVSQRYYGSRLSEAFQRALDTDELAPETARFVDQRLRQIRRQR